MTDDLQRVDPHHLDAECAILGAILVENAQLDAAQTLGLTEAQFYRDAHRRIYRALVTLAGRRSGLDLVTVKNELDRTGDLEAVGGPSYLASVMDGIPRSTNVPHYVALVQEAATRRALIQVGRTLVEDALVGADPAAAVLDRTLQALVSVTAASQTGRLVEGAEIAQAALAYLEELQQRRAKGAVSGVPTGFRELDVLLDGFHPGQLIIVGGRTSEGKTSLALQFALTSESCAFFSCEMEVAELALRQLAVLARIDGWALRRGFLSSGEYARVSHALSALAECGVAIDDTAAISLAQIRARARQRQVLHGLKLIVVDYLQLMTAEAGKRDGTREQDVAGLARGLKALAKELKVPVMALSQFNRSLKPGEEPHLGHLRESGELEQAANVALLIHRPDGQTVAKEGDVDVIVAKNRGGPKGTVTLRWYPAETRFGEPLGTPEPEQQRAFA